MYIFRERINRKRAINTMERILNKEDFPDSAASIFQAVKEIVHNKELEKYIETQINHRRRMKTKRVIRPTKRKSGNFKEATVSKVEAQRSRRSIDHLHQKSPMAPDFEAHHIKRS